MIILEYLIINLNFSIKNICCGYSLMNTHNICFYGEIRKSTIICINKNTCTPP